MARSLGAKLSSQEMSVFVAASLASMFEPWIQITLAAWVALLGSAAAIFFGYIVSVIAICTGDVSFTVQFRYVGLIAALILGYVFFAEWPDAFDFIGAGGDRGYKRVHPLPATGPAWMKFYVG
tara:strand:- start:166 stop:534 length:369 start_codon:yes stop_codon:yes gene_type:complete